MANVTFSLPADTYEYMKKYTEIRWSVVVQKAINQYIGKLEQSDRFFEKYSVRKLFEEGEEADAIFKI